MADLLLVDNDERIVELTTWFLRNAGHEVRSALSYALAREALTERLPDLLLADLDLGLENGLDELPRLAREGRLPPTLVVSGFLDAELEGQLRRVPGVVGTLSKPVDLDVLLERIGACLNSGTIVPTPAPELRQARGLPVASPERVEAGPVADDGWVEIVPLDSESHRGERPR